MSVPKLEIGREGLIKLCEVLGMETLPIKRIILDINLDGMVSVYTDQYCEAQTFDKVLDLFVHAQPKTQRKSSGQPSGGNAPPLPITSSQLNSGNIMPPIKKATPLLSGGVAVTQLTPQEPLPNPAEVLKEQIANVCKKLGVPERIFKGV